MVASWSILRILKIISTPYTQSTFLNSFEEPEFLKYRSVKKSTKYSTNKSVELSLVFLLISNLTNGLRLHQFLVTKSAEANKSVKTDANGAH